eukprot:Ihof_evm3s117 gene=Ihof_evmTU3s117
MSKRMSNCRLETVCSLEKARYSSVSSDSNEAFFDAEGGLSLPEGSDSGFFSARASKENASVHEEPDTPLSIRLDQDLENLAVLDVMNKERQKELEMVPSETKVVDLPVTMETELEPKPEPHQACNIDTDLIAAQKDIENMTIDPQPNVSAHRDVPTRSTSISNDSTRAAKRFSKTETLRSRNEPLETVDSWCDDKSPTTEPSAYARRILGSTLKSKKKKRTEALENATREVKIVHKGPGEFNGLVVAQTLKSEGVATTMTFSRDGTFLAVTGSDCVVRVWCAVARQHLYVQMCEAYGTVPTSKPSESPRASENCSSASPHPTSPGNNDHHNNDQHTTNITTQDTLTHSLSPPVSESQQNNENSFADTTPSTCETSTDVAQDQSLSSDSTSSTSELTESLPDLAHTPDPTRETSASSGEHMSALPNESDDVNPLTQSESGTPEDISCGEKANADTNVPARPNRPVVPPRRPLPYCRSSSQLSLDSSLSLESSSFGVIDTPTQSPLGLCRNIRKNATSPSLSRPPPVPKRIAMPSPYPASPPQPSSYYRTDSCPIPNRTLDNTSARPAVRAFSANLSPGATTASSRVGSDDANFGYISRMSCESLAAPSTREEVFLDHPVAILSGHEALITDLAWSQANFLLTSSQDYTIRLWHVTQSQCLKVIQLDTAVMCVAFHPKEEMLFVAGSLSKLYLYNMDNNTAGGALRCMKELPVTHYTIITVAFCDNGESLVVGSMEGHCFFYNLNMEFRTSKSFNRSSQRSGHVNCIIPVDNESSVLDSPKILVGSKGGRLRLVDLRNYNVDVKFKGHVNNTLRLKASVSYDGCYLACGSEDGNLFLWNMTQRQKSKSFESYN